MDRRKKVKQTRWVTFGIIAVILSGGISLFAMRPVTAAYQSVEAQTGDIETYYSFSGNVAAKNRQNLFSERTVQISKIHVRAGEAVEAGEILLTTTTGVHFISEINGEVTNIYVEENEQITPGMKMMDIIDYKNLEVIFKADEYDIRVLEKGKQAIVRINAVECEIRGIIREISKEGQIVNGVTFFTASIDLEENEKIRIGMSAEVRLLSNKAEDVVILPMKVIQFDDRSLPYVLLNGKKNKVVKKRIITGIHDGMFVEVKSGVVSGQDILFTNNIALEELLFPQGGKNTNVFLGGSNE